MPVPAVFIATLVAFQILLLFVHLALYAALAAAFGIGSGMLEAIFIVLAFTFVAATLLARLRHARALDWFYAAAAYWFGLAHFLFVGAVVLYFAASILYARNIYVAPALIGAISFGAFFLIHLYGTWSSGRVRVTRAQVALRGLPAAWQGKKIVFISDLHLGNIHKEDFAAKVARRVNALAPEAILIGGDLYDGPPCDIEKLAEPLRAMRAPRGIYFITGNHEYYMAPGDRSRALAAVRAFGWRILDNEKIDLDGLTVAGVDDKSTHDEKDFEKALAAMGSPHGQAPAILMRHEPDFLVAGQKAGYALMLCGHTHQGQIFPLNYITRTMYRGFDYGLKRLGDMQVYTSSGAGTWGPPLRLGTRSEVAFIELSSARQ